jgi:hypothetical protein
MTRCRTSGTCAVCSRPAFPWLRSIPAGGPGRGSRRTGARGSTSAPPACGPASARALTRAVPASELRRAVPALLPWRAWRRRIDSEAQGEAHHVRPRAGVPTPTRSPPDSDLLSGDGCRRAAATTQEIPVVMRDRGVTTSRAKPESPGVNAKGSTRSSRRLGEPMNSRASGTTPWARPRWRSRSASEAAAAWRRSPLMPALLTRVRASAVTHSAACFEDPRPSRRYRYCSRLPSRSRYSSTLISPRA